MSLEKITIKDARVNNLNHINLELPRDKMIVFTGLSGSGKSSLAFDTIYAEGQRRYVESLSSYARQFLGQMDKPDVESIEGLSPSISIDQKTTNRNPRSTVGTVTEIYDYLRLLYAKIGIPHCPVCGEEIKAMSIDQMVDRVMALEEKSRILILSPVVVAKKGEHKKIIDNIQKQGFTRVKIDGEVIDLSIDEVKIDKNKKHDIEIVVDRLVIKEGIESRLSGSLETSLELSEGGRVLIDVVGKETFIMSSSLSCPNGHMSLGEISPRIFSFNAPFGACEACDGIGYHKSIDINLVLPDKSLTLNEGAIKPFANSKKGTYYYEIIKAIAKRYNFDMDTPLDKAPKEMINELLYGSKKEVTFTFNSHFRHQGKSTTILWEGVVENLSRRHSQSFSNAMKEKIEDYMAEVTCEKCHGQKLKDEVLAITIMGKNIIEITDLSIKEAYDWVSNIDLDKSSMIISEPIVKEIKARLNFLIEVGLDYLTMSRAAGTLSGGESQRIRLATQIGAGLVGVVYVLDEPSIGLHQRDNEKLLKSLRNLTSLGNTLIVVEHDEDTMKESDLIVDIGPGAGVHGGNVVAYGTYDEIKKNKDSITGQYLSGKKFIPVPEERRKPKGFIEVKGAKQNNLKNIDVKFPLGVLTLITGVSGSGKSSLVNQIFYNGLMKKLHGSRLKVGDHKEIIGGDQIDKIIQIDQSPIGRTPRSNPVTYTKTFDNIRDVFAQTNEAKIRGYDKGRFSFNVKGGRCENCSGDGVIKVEMHFLPDVYVPCEVCNGKRYNRETLQVKYKDKDISDVLNMTVEEGLEFFKAHEPIRRKLQTLYDVGLSYIKLGQPSTELSGGEAQRIKLASELAKVSTGNTLYVLDEPTTGLHTADIHKLIKVLNELVEAGNTVVVIEHNLDVIKTADYIIDLGPEGGDKGGEIVVTGTPEEVVKNKKSYTGKFLKPYLK
ncbi:excinuclease ABC subunit UvrA [Helcococcus kunzii]|uniref:excinuclease ABC subunit UvrA n=1 Tax=Helcococcus kunzii TaxID=40091 RepID=UPI0021A911CD|nr:excinuclease ABC subunit UvrA [Helcococcus kunzii]MCT1796154.1 excinuclease ABC subunit UvrA [Helcococcus kunzii]MCT1989233.1 excinuclease ABC subunit UvrA [Helcococcus kunzii]